MAKRKAKKRVNAKSKRYNWAPLILIVLALAAIGIAILPGLKSQATVKYAEIGEPAPDFSLTSLDGKKVSLSQLKGRPVVVNFWAIWCPPCKLEMPALEGLSKDAAAKGFSLLTVNQEEDKSTVENFLEDNGYTFPVVLDSSGDVSELYKVTGIPTTVFINSKGIITDIHLGTMPDEKLFLEKVQQ